jgi:hypothetical protein
MSLQLATTLQELREAIAGNGYAFAAGATMQTLLANYGDLTDWDAFAASWNKLELDEYMADGGRYRRRRFAVYATVADGAVERRPHAPHFQSREYNPLHGGIPRWFTPIATEVGEGPSMRAILQFCRDLFGRLVPFCQGWHIEVHQFRIEANAESAGLPTPEGMHRDGVDYVLAMLVARHNIASGTTAIGTADGQSLGSFTLTDPFDAALVDDARVYHGVTPVTALDPNVPAYRDVIVVTFRCKPSSLPS